MFDFFARQQRGNKHWSTRKIVITFGKAQPVSSTTSLSISTSYQHYILRHRPPAPDHIAEHNRPGLYETFA
jgi:hypothetical protein